MNKQSSRESFDEIERARRPWDAALVGKRLVEAFDTLDRMPGIRGPRGAGSNWPATVIEWADQLAWAGLTESERLSREAEANRIVVHPSAAEISRMEAAFDWLGELRSKDFMLARLITLWALRTARGESIKRLCAENHWTPHTFFRKRTKALEWLAAMLNRKGCST